MNELEVCKRIAEIEGETIEHITNDGVLFVSSDDFEPYNPLKDSALCFALMVKHKVELKYYIDGSIDAWITFKNQETYSDAKEAICSEIIKAN